MLPYLTYNSKKKNGKKYHLIRFWGTELSCNKTVEPWYVASLRKVAANPDTMVYFYHVLTAKIYKDKYGIKPPEGREWYISKESLVSTSRGDYLSVSFWG